MDDCLVGTMAMMAMIILLVMVEMTVTPIVITNDEW